MPTQDQGGPPTDDPDGFGATVRAARERNGLSMGQLGELLGVAKSQVLRWERNDYAPSPTALVTIAQVLELDQRELFALAKVPTPSDLPSLPAMLRREYDLPPEAIAEIQRNIENVANKYRRESRQDK